MKPTNLTSFIPRGIWKIKEINKRDDKYMTDDDFKRILSYVIFPFDIEVGESARMYHINGGYSIHPLVGKVTLTTEVVDIMELNGSIQFHTRNTEYVIERIE